MLLLPLSCVGFWQLTLYWFWFFRVPNGGHLKFDFDRFWQRNKNKNTGNRYLMRIQPRARVNVLISTTWPIWGRFGGATTSCSMPRPSKHIERGLVGGERKTYNLYYKYSPHQSAFICSIHTTCLAAHSSNIGNADKNKKTPTNIEKPPPPLTAIQLLSYCHCQTIVS